MQGLISPSTPLLPASEITLIYFVSHLAKTVSYNTIKLYLFAVQDLHRQYNFPLNLPKMFRLQKVLTPLQSKSCSLFSTLTNRTRVVTLITLCSGQPSP